MTPGDEMMDASAPGAPGATAGLLAEATATRRRLVDRLEQLDGRLSIEELIRDLSEMLQHGVKTEVTRVTNEWKDVGVDLLEDALEFAGRHRGLLIGGTVATLVAVAGLTLARRRKPVPLYAAYDMEDPEMMNTEMNEMADEAGTAFNDLKDRAGALGARVKDSAGELGNKAGEAYYSARAKAAQLADSVRDEAHHAADVARERAREAAEIARQKAHEAADAAREAADRAREAAGEAREWAVRQPKDNPMTVVVVALAVGALVGALLPALERRER